MARSYSFDHFTAARPAVSPWKRASSHEKQTLTHGHGPEPIHYGQAHARTGMLYQQHREDFERLQSVKEPQVSARSRDVEEQQESSRVDLFGREGIQEIKRLAVDSVKRAARSAARGRPLQGARQLASDAVSGTLRVVREAADRTSRLASELSTEQAKKSDREP